jgi:hypothetical protein
MMIQMTDDSAKNALHGSWIWIWIWIPTILTLHERWLWTKEEKAIIDGWKQQLTGDSKKRKLSLSLWHATKIHEWVYLEVDEFQLIQAQQVRTDHDGIQTNSEDALEYKDEYQQETVDWRSTGWNYWSIVFDAAEIVEPVYKATCGDNRDDTVVTFAPRKQWNAEKGWVPPRTAQTCPSGRCQGCWEISTCCMYCSCVFGAFFSGR